MSILNPKETLFSQSGRQYDKPDRFLRKNTILSGRRLLCRGCKSDLHLIRDCPKVNRPRLVYSIMQNYADVNENVLYGASLEDILNDAQNLSDES